MCHCHIGVALVRRFGIGHGWLLMVVGGCGWQWVVVDSSGWLWMAVGRH